MKYLFLTVLEISVSTSLIVLALLTLAPILNRRYASKWKYYIWIALAFRLVIPFNLKLPAGQAVIEIPGAMTVPIAADTETAVPVTLQTGSKLMDVTLLDLTAVIWFMVCLCILLVHFFSYWRYKAQIISKGACVESSLILRQLSSLRKALRIKTRISIIKYAGAASPMMIGFVRPILVLPDYEYSREELFFILKHELIHLKRHDIHVKLLFVIANAVHWFNPLIYIMQKEAGVDMELSCDEGVVLGTDFAVRKAYTEALFSTLHRQYEKTTALTTQFYGGNQIMKKRFKNILIKSKKKSGLSILVCAVGITLMLGMMTGCSVMEPGPSGTQPDSGFSDGRTDDMRADDKEALGGEASDNANVQTAPTQTPEPEESDPLGASGINNPEAALSEDGQEIKSIAENFAAAYFSGDTAAIQSFLTSSYEWDVDVYAGLDEAGAGTISELTLKGLTDIGKEETGSTKTVSLEFRDSNFEDMFISLTITFVKQEDGWKIQFYGLEG